MPLPDIDFQHIRSVNGSQHDGFEEFCAQLASLQETSVDSTFHRTGRGADAGVECFSCYPDGSEIGWQAKYIFAWDASLATQLDKSIDAALTKHPNLKEYIVCLPFDLSDARRKGAQSAQQKWNNWRAKWIQKAKSRGISLEILLWGKSRLCSLLADDDPNCAGRILYWFDEEIFSQTWFGEKFNSAKAALGRRYTPETNVALPIRRSLIAFARGPELQKEVDDWFLRLSEEGRAAAEATRRVEHEESEAQSDQVRDVVLSLASGLRVDATASVQFPLEDWRSGADRCLEQVRATYQWIRSLELTAPEDGDKETLQSARYCLHTLIEFLLDFDHELATDRWQLTAIDAVLLTGAAGSGKSHLLADVVEHQIENGRPAILLLGSIFVDGEPWRQILTELDRPLVEQVKHFLGGLDSAAQAANRRALICIDALNERNGIDVWPERLAAFLKTMEPFSRIGVVLSCRSTFLEYVVPSHLSNADLYQIEHKGFAVTGGQAAQTYLEMRGIVRPGAPNLVPEFENPLFLKSCCDYLEKIGESELPRSLRGVTSIFEFYNKAVTGALNKRMKLDPHQEIIPRAISGLTNLFIEAGKGYVPKSEVIQLFEAICSSGGRLDKSLTAQLESEGVITVELLRQDDRSVIEMVRFTFERFCDHQIASKVLDENLDLDDVDGSFNDDTRLHEIIFGNRSYERAGIVEAIAVQLPERAGVELLDVDAATNRTVRQAFVDSLLWREQSKFTDRTFDLAQEVLCDFDFFDLLIEISTEPTNKFNARYINEHLQKLTMPERDEEWSTLVVEQGYSGSVETLISWSCNNGFGAIDAERASLAATVLCWLLTTSHRAVRDKATKALSCVLSTRLSLASQLLREFRQVDDLYLQERLLAACYGAVLQGVGSVVSLNNLAQTVFEIIFAENEPPANALLRDHARGIVSYAEKYGGLESSFDLSLVSPPYRSPWPIEHVTDELIDSYKESYGEHRLRDEIVSSTVNDGDFAVYRVNYALDNWSPAAIDADHLPTPAEVFDEWNAQFQASTSEEQKDAFALYISAAELARHASSFEETPEALLFKSAEAEFKGTMGEVDWEEFRTKARDYIRNQMFSDYQHKRPATFNVAWGRRWICKRAHELGWSVERFGSFDRHCGNHDRHDHEIERIGKKYQWLAFQEIVARMSDNLSYLGTSGEGFHEDVLQYTGARQIGLRDIDPSLLIAETYYDGWREWEKKWWLPRELRLRDMGPAERITWLESDTDIINDKDLIELYDPKSNRHWLTLRGFSRWAGHGISRGQKEIQRETWFRLSCVIVRRSDLKKLLRRLRGKTLTDPHSLPTLELHEEFYLGEYSWHPEVEYTGWLKDGDDWHGYDMPIGTTVASYYCERGGYDYSIDKTVHAELPAPWLVDQMNLKLTNGRQLAYVNNDGEQIFFDPSVSQPGPSAAIIDRDAFLESLDDADLSPVWVIAGEKNAYGGQGAGIGFGGRFLHTKIYYRKNGKLESELHTEWLRPTRTQLQEFFGSEDVPADFQTDNFVRD